MKPAKSKNLKKTPARSRSGSLNQDPVEVYCRVKPLFNGTSCIQVLSSTTIQLSPPESNINKVNGNFTKEVQYTYKQVFDDKVTQKEVFDAVALPLVSQLVSGKNGLLFTYGVTGSGKTYTMNGVSNNGGIMPRCLDVLFNSISSCQAKKYIFKPDGMNGFDVQDEADAMLAYQNELKYFNQAAKSKRRRDVLPDGSDCQLPKLSSSVKVNSVDEDFVYSVFVSYIEIYNNYVYDLLDNNFEDAITRKLQNKLIREDAFHNMYVHGVTEVEVKSSEDAFEVYSKGQKRKRVANTMLNDVSSRSHAVFTIRLVQAPLSSDGETLIQDRKLACVSQLSLVDLAGSERTNRTQNTGQRLREAGNINNSLMVLRQCLEALRDNQINGANKIVPYRESKLTMLFKNYFDGEGIVRVIVCVNPSIDDYEETVQVMKFAEVTQEVQVERPTPIRPDVGLASGRRRANLFAKRIQQELSSDHVLPLITVTSTSTTSEFNFKFPSLLVTDSKDEETVRNITLHLEQRMKARTDGWEESLRVEELFRQSLMKFEKENALREIEINDAKTALDFERKNVLNLTNKMEATRVNYDSLRREVEEKNRLIETLKLSLREKEMLINQQTFEKEKVKEKYVNKIAVTKEKLTKEMNAKINQKCDQMSNEMRNDRNKLKLLKEVLDDNGAVSGSSATSFVTPRSAARLRAAADRATPMTLNNQGTFYLPPQASSENRRGVAVSNPRHRRSRSAGGVCGGSDDVWLDHRPLAPVKLNTVMQPTMRKRKSVTKLTDVKDVVNSRTSKYCLTTQEQDTDGELETRLYKGDVIPTSGGGAQVVLNDIELLKQISPSSGGKTKKRSLVDVVDTTDRCNVAVEGHGKRLRP